MTPDDSWLVNSTIDRFQGKPSNREVLQRLFKVMETTKNLSKSLPIVAQEIVNLCAGENISSIWNIKKKIKYLYDKYNCTKQNKLRNSPTEIAKRQAMSSELDKMYDVGQRRLPQPQGEEIPFETLK